jgi:transmembrane sensor
MNTQIHEEAANWLVELRTSDNDAATRRRFDAWIRKSPEHLRAYLELTEIWQDASFVGDGTELSRAELIANARTDDNVVSLSEEEKGGRKPSRLNSSLLTPHSSLKFWSAIAASIFIVALGMWFYLQRDTYMTTIGEQRTLRLADGSTIELNSQSRVRVRYTDRERNVELLAGQALFRVAKDRARPFIVKTDGTQVRAVGTQFDIYRRPNGTTVTVLEGRVLVTQSAVNGEQPRENFSLPTFPLSPITLTAGEQVTLKVAAPTDDRSLPTEVKPADLETATAWTRQQLIFKSTPLSEVADEFNRYNTRKLAIDCDTQICDLKISGVYSSTDPDVLITFLREQPGVTVDDTGDEIIVARIR